MSYPHDHLLGKTGQHAVIAEFLRRGYNVALPEVDVGDDFLVLDGRPGGFSRVQVKTSSTTRLKTEWGFQAQFFIPTRQLFTPQRPNLFYILAARLADEQRDAAREHANTLADAADTGEPATEIRWEFLVLARKTLLVKHRRHGFGIFGNERVMMGLTFRRDSVTGHGLDLQPFRNNFARYWPQTRRQRRAR